MYERKKIQARGLARVSHFFLSGREPPKEKVTIQVAAKALDVSKGTIIIYLNKGLQEKQQKELMDFKKATEAKDQGIEKTQARLLAGEEELQRDFGALGG